MTKAQARAREITVIPEYAPDKAAQIRALTYVLRLPLDPEIAVRQREAHFRDCPTCSAGGSDGMCPDGRWYAERADRAMADTTTTAASAAGTGPIPDESETRQRG